MAESDDASHVVIEIAPDEMDFVRQVAATEKVSVVETTTEGFEPVTMVTLLLIGSALAVASVTHIVEQRRGGQVIDLRPHAARRFYRSKDVLYGLVMMLHPDGTVTVDVKQPQELFGQVLESLTTVITGLGKASLAAVAAAAEQVVGDRGTVTVRQAAEVE